MYGVWILVIIVIVVVNLGLAVDCRDIANDKGQNGDKWFHVCFWFSIIGYILVVALPDLKAHELQEETNKLLKELIKAQNNSGTTTQVATASTGGDVRSYLPEL